MPQKKKVIAFDYDGVIVDSFLTNYEIYKVICKKLGKKIPGTFEGYKNIYGKTYHELSARLGIATLQEKEIAERIYEKESLERVSPVFKGINEVLESLSKNYSLVVVSATYKSAIKKDLLRKGLLGYFGEIIAKEDSGFAYLNKTVLLKNLVGKFGEKNVLFIGDRDKRIGF